VTQTQALQNGQDDIEAVRLVRDPESLIGKGIGYILFKDRDSVLKALSLHEVKGLELELGLESRLGLELEVGLT
jgi:hypothetical protein